MSIDHVPIAHKRRKAEPVVIHAHLGCPVPLDLGEELQGLLLLLGRLERRLAQPLLGVGGRGR